VVGADVDPAGVGGKVIDPVRGTALPAPSARRNVGDGVGADAVALAGHFGGQRTGSRLQWRRARGRGRPPSAQERPGRRPRPVAPATPVRCVGMWSAHGAARREPG
jgi:hypothetical protein